MNGKLLLPRFAMGLALLLEALISRAITGSALHEGLLPVAAVLFLAIRYAGPVVSRVSSLILSTAVGMGAWWLFERGWAPVSLSELPAAFSFAVGLHFWVWTRVMGSRARRDFDGESDWHDTPLPAGLALVSGAVIVWATAKSEIYGTSISGIRAMAVGVLAMSAAVAGWGSGWGPADASIPVRVWRSPRGRWRGWAAALSMAVLFLVGGVWTMGGADRLGFALFQWLGQDSDVTQLSDFGKSQPVVVEGSGLDDGAMRDLPRCADIHLDESVRFRIQIEGDLQFREATSRPLYLRTSVLVIFAGDGRLGPRRQGSWIYDSDDAVTDGVTRLEANATGDRGFGYWVLIDRSWANSVPLMDGTRTVGLPAIYAFADGWFQLALTDEQEQVRFHAGAAPHLWEEVRTRPGLEAGDAPPEYRQLPSTPLAGRVADLARQSAPGGLPLAERMAALETLIRSRCHYSLEYQNPDNLEPIENFLFAERKGHCELYAASTVMMLRSIGVPSRIAFGFTGGESDPGRGLIAFRQSDYHAWAEVFLEDLGWTVFDTTPVGSGAVRSARANPRAAAFASFDPAAYEDLGGELLPSQVRGTWFSRWVTRSIDWVADWFPLWCLAGGLMVVASVWRRLRAARKGPAGENFDERWPFGVEFGSKGRESELLKDYLAAWSSRGEAKLPGQTLAEFLATLKARGLCGDEFDEMTRYFYRLRYAGGEPNGEAEESYRRAIDAMEKRRPSA